MNTISIGIPVAKSQDNYGEALNLNEQLYKVKKDDPQLGLQKTNSQIISEIINERNSRKIEETNLSDSPKIKEKLTSYITQKMNDRIEKIKRDGKLEIEGGEIDTALSENELNNIKEITSSDIKFIKSEQKQITIKGNSELFNIIQLEIRGIKYTAIEIPESLRNRPLKDMELGKRLIENKGESRFVNIDFDKLIETGWIVWETENHRDSDGKIYTNIATKDTDNSTDILRECAKIGMKPISISENVILGEIVKYSLGKEYLDYKGYKADSDESGYEEIRKKIQEIDNLLGLKLGEYKDIDGINYIIRNRGIYLDKDNYTNAFLRGHSAVRGCLGSSLSLWLNCRARDRNSERGFRASV